MGRTREDLEVFNAHFVEDSGCSLVALYTATETASFARYQARSFESFSSQEASVDSFLQNVKRTWRAPMA